MAANKNPLKFVLRFTPGGSANKQRIQLAAASKNATEEAEGDTSSSNDSDDEPLQKTQVSTSAMSSPVPASATVTPSMLRDDRGTQNSLASTAACDLSQSAGPRKKGRPPKKPRVDTDIVEAITTPVRKSSRKSRSRLTMTKSKQKSAKSKQTDRKNDSSNGNAADKEADDLIAQVISTIVDQHKPAVVVHSLPSAERKPETFPVQPVVEVVSTKCAPVAVDLSKFSSLQLLLDQLLAVLRKKDPEEFFTKPVTDAIAPNYSSVIRQPMDLNTMRQKVEQNAYGSISDFKADLLLICSNAITYNDPDTIYYTAARKLQTLSNCLFNKENMTRLSRVLPVMQHLTTDQLGFPVEDLAPVAKRQKVMGHYDCITEMNTDDILQRARNSAKNIADKLAARRVKTHICTLKQQENGSVSLHFLTPRVNLEEDNVVTLGSLVGKLPSGNPGVALFSENPQNRISPIQYLNYDVYSTFAPSYDSTWATISKQDSHLLLSTYGSAVGVEYAQSLREFAGSPGGYLTSMVDNILDTVTNGEHSRLLGKAETTQQRQASEPQRVVPDVSQADIDLLKTLAQQGIDVSFLDGLESSLPSTSNSVMADCVGDRVEQAGQLLHALSVAQHERLSKPPPLELTATSGPSEVELDVAASFTAKLSDCIANVAPGQLISTSALQQMHWNPYCEPLVVDTNFADYSGKHEQPESDGYDLDVLREFLQVDHLQSSNRSHV